MKQHNNPGSMLPTVRLIFSYFLVILCVACAAPSAPVTQTAVPSASAGALQSPTHAPAPTEAPPTSMPTTIQPTAETTQSDAVLLQSDGNIELIQGASRMTLVQGSAIVAPDPAQCSTAGSLVWSPDGQRLATGQGVWTLGEHPPATSVLSPIAGWDYRWSPDSQQLAYLTGVGQDTDLLMLAGPDGAEARQVASSHWSQTGHPAWSPDGHMLIAGPSMQVNLGSADALALPQEIGRNAAWSHDGKLLAWTVADEDDAMLRLRFVTWDGAQQKDIATLTLPRDTNYPENNIWWTDPGWTFPRLFWLPDDSALLVPIMPTGLQHDGGTYLINRDGTTTRLSPHMICDLAPDGQRMLVRTDAGVIAVANAADGMVTNELGTGVTAAWRPTLQGPVPPAPLAVQSPTLRLATPRMQGDAVKAAQQRLADLKYDVGTVDGIFGPQTAMAVKAFQQHNGLNVDGIIGPRTWAALRAPGACPADAAEGMC
jgi:hypothetical protein